MTDRQLLELAAKAAGLPIWIDDSGVPWFDGDKFVWNPLTDDGDALRLAVKLLIQVRPEPEGSCNVQTISGFMRTESGYSTTEAATRRAIVRAAAEIGKAMP